MRAILGAASRRILLVGGTAFLILTTLCVISSLSPANSDQTITLNVAGWQRTCVLHFPPAYESTGTQLLPVVILYHGSRHNGGIPLDSMTGFSTLADQKGFIVAYPDGDPIDGDWTCLIGQVNPMTIVPPSPIKYDDVGFTRAMIDLFCSSYRGDPNRIFVAGVSAGGYMVYRLAVELPDKIAAAGVVAGGLGIFSVNGIPVQSDIPKPASPVSLIQIHGLIDAAATYEGGQHPKNKALSVPAAIGFFVSSNRCLEAPKEKYDKATHVRKVRYGGCDAGTEVELVVLEKKGHGWPSLASDGLSATQTLWEFFSTHPRAGGLGQ